MKFNPATTEDYNHLYYVRQAFSLLVGKHVSVTYSPQELMLFDDGILAYAVKEDMYFADPPTAESTPYQHNLYQTFVTAVQQEIPLATLSSIIQMVTKEHEEAAT